MKVDLYLSASGEQLDETEARVARREFDMLLALLTQHGTASGSFSPDGVVAAEAEPDLTAENARLKDENALLKGDNARLSDKLDAAERKRPGPMGAVPPQTA